jgi:hypothetical protein
VILDARYEKIRQAGVIISQAVLIAVAVDSEGRRQVLGGALIEQTNWLSGPCPTDRLSSIGKCDSNDPHTCENNA